MNEEAIFSTYRKKMQDYAGVLKSLRKRDNLIAMFRLLAFVMAVVSFIYYIQHPAWYRAGLPAVFFCVFLGLMKTSLQLEARIKHLRMLVKINERELEAAGERYDSFDSGKEFITPNHMYAADLDIFGHGSLFQMLNRTCTVSGKLKLASWLMHPKKNAAEIRFTQQALQELSQKLDWRQHYEATGGAVSESMEEKEQLFSWLKAPAHFFHKPLYRLSRFLLPSLTMVLLLLAVFNLAEYRWFIFSFLFQLAFVGFHLKHINLKHAQVSKKFHIIHNYSRLLKHIETETFKNERLVHLKSDLCLDGEVSSKHVKALAGIINALDQRLNIVMGSVLNGFLLWDIQCMIRLEEWQERFKEVLPQWINVLSEFDALSSLAGFAYNNFDFSYPEPEEKGVVLNAKNLGHPLINRKSRIPNDFELNGQSQIVILTGANMAGKSTFLRAIGVNMILAMTGAPVCASYFKFHPIDLYTSLRTNDSLQKHESFFFAELKKIKLIMEQYRQGKMIFILLDEILKGTNSKDQHNGSESLIRKLIELKGVGLIATHDIELARLQQQYPDNIINLCFEIGTDHDKLVFDYKIKPGVCSTMNASILMRQMGIIE